MELARQFAVPASRARVCDLARRLPSPVLLGLLVAAIAALDVWWRTIETRPPHWDMGRHLGNSLFYLHGFSLTDPLPFLDAYRYYPPLVYWITDVFYFVSGSEALWLAILSNVVWLAVLVFATYGIGARLWNARVGWLSVVFVVTAPMVVSSSKEYMLDVPLTAMAALALYLLIRAEGFSSRRHSLLFGVACGCGLLVKWTFPFFLALPLGYALAVALAEARLRRRFAPLLNLAGAATLAFAVAGTWYVHNRRVVGGDILFNNGPEGAARGNPPTRSLASALWYLWSLLNDQLYLLPLLFLVVGVAFCFRRRELAARNRYPLLMLVGTYLTFTLLRHKDPRYTLPMLPAAAIVATSWLEYLSGRARASAAAVFVSYGAVAFVAISFGTSLLPKTIGFDVPSTSFGPGQVTVFRQSGYLIGPPTKEDWHQADAFRTIARFPRSQRSFDFEGPESIWFNDFGLDYFSRRFDADWVHGRQAHFLILRGSARTTPPGYARLERWRLPDAGTLALYARTRASPT